MMDNDSIFISMIKEGAREYLLKASNPYAFKQSLDSIRDTGFYI
ncbi:MAG: hypothetical protein ACSLE0_10345 [Chitinophagaceae bacterium]